MKGDGFGIVSVFVISHCFLYSAASYFAEQKLLFFFFTRSRSNLMSLDMNRCGLFCDLEMKFSRTSNPVKKFFFHILSNDAPSLCKFIRKEFVKRAFSAKGLL